MAKATAIKEKKINHADKTLEVGVAAGLISAVALTQGFNFEAGDSLFVGTLAAGAGWGIGKMLGHFIGSNPAAIITSAAIGAVPAATVAYHMIAG